MGPGVIVPPCPPKRRLCLYVTNDLAERGIKVLQNYKDILTEDSEHKEVILHCVEKSHQERPDLKKSTLASTS